jgi:Tol biopolymer transport system component
MSRWEIAKGTFAVSAALAVIAGPILAAVFVWNVPQRVEHFLKCTNNSLGSPTWSPNGRWIAYTSQTLPECNPELVAIHPDGSGFHVLLRADVSWPAWSNDGRWILVKGQNGYAVVRTHGGQLETVDVDRSDAGAAWSPDGSQIAFTLGFVPGPGGDYESDLWIASRTGAGKRKVIGHACDPGGPGWSPNGRELAVGCYDGVYLIDPSTDRARRIFSDSFGFTPPTPAWSPDGRSLVFVEADGRGVCTMHEDGRDFRVVAHVTSLGWPDAAAWSPSGRWIAYSVSNGAPRDGLYLVHPNGTDKHRIATF